MIDEAACNAVGVVTYAGERKGHCVLIAPTRAITCAHVFSESAGQPQEPIGLEFPNLRLTVAAQVTAWRPFDRGLAPGSDLALLTFEGAARAPDDAHARLAKRRPGRGVLVAAVDFLGPRPDGEAREGKVLDGRGALLSLEGAYFIDKGMSGTGVFHQEPADRLVGLVAGRPTEKGQTTGYAIPADLIVELLGEASEKAASDKELRASVDVLTRVLADVVPGNLFDRRYADTVLEILDKPADTWGEEDLLALRSLQWEFRDACGSEGDSGGTALPAGLAAALASLDDVLKRLQGGAVRADELVDVNEEMESLIRKGLEEVERLLASDTCPAEAKKPLEHLARTLRIALDRSLIRLGELSDGTQLARRRAAGLFEAGARALMCCIGRRADLAPALAVFADGPEPWCPEMVVIPAGRFVMGSPEKEEGRRDTEGPQHEVSVPRFALGKYPVTFAEYDAFCAATGREKPGDEGWGRGDRPVIDVSWEDAQAYVAWLSEQTGQVYRLPSEAEWEYACRAGTTTPFWTGATISTDQANYDGRFTYGAGKKGEDREQTTPVDSFPANRWGLFDMHGNVWEWVADCWHATYEGAPTDGSAWLEGTEFDRVLRGGSWLYAPWDLRSACRSRYFTDNRGGNIGFRVARTLTP